MADETLTMELRLRDALSKGLGDVNKRLDEMSGAARRTSGVMNTSFASFTKFLGPAGIAVGAGLSAKAVVGFFNDARKAAEEQAQAEAKLRTALGYTSRALIDQADALQKSTMFTDDAILAGQAMLGNYIKNEDQIKKLTPAVLDFAQATGMDLASAARLVATTIAGDTAEMGRYRVAVEGAAGSTERIDSLLKGLNETFGGQAKAANDASDGVAQLGKSWGELQETIGMALKGPMKEATASLSGWLDMLNRSLKNGVPAAPDEREQILKRIDDLERLTKAYEDLQKAKAADEAAGMRSAGADPKAAETYAAQIEELEKLRKQIAPKKNVVGGSSGKDSLKGTFETLIGGEGLEDMAKRATEAYAKVVEAHGGYVDAWEDTEFVKNHTEAVRNMLEVSTSLHHSELQKQIDAVIAWKDSQLAVVEDAITKDTILTTQGEELKTQITEEANRRRTDIVKAYAEQQARAQMEANFQIADHYTWLADTITTQLRGIAEAAGANAEQMKAIRTMEVIIDGAAAGIAAARTIWSSSASWQEALAETIIVEGLLTANTIAQVAAIQSAKYARGGQFVTNGEQMITVGDNPGGRELVTVTPLGSSNFNGPQGASVSVGDTNIIINGQVGAAEVRQINMSLYQHRRQLEEMFRSGYIKPSRLGLQGI